MRRFLHRLLLRVRPRPAAPPPLPEDLSQATFPQLRRHVVYQLRTLRRLSQDPERTAIEQAAARDRADDIRGLLGAHPLLEDLRRCIRETRLDPDAPDTDPSPIPNSQ